MPALALINKSPSGVSVAPQDIHADVWHAHTLAQSAAQAVPTGHAPLDAQLPGGGWPQGALTELLQPDGVHSEWRLLLPALARSGTGPVVMVGAPHVPFAPSLTAQGLVLQRLLQVGAQTTAERLWATEQVLRCADVDAVLAWLPQVRSDPVRSDQLRRLQMAAAEYHKLLFVMRPQQVHSEASPAALRLQIAPATGLDAEADQDALQVRVLKRRGPPLVAPLQVRARGAPLDALLAAARPRRLFPLTHRRWPVSAHALDRPAANA